jgi:mono/diheme cytochrome c family protein
MPPFASLSDQERWDVVAYAFTLSASADAQAQGSQLYATNCASCHGEGGAGDGQAAASLGVPVPSFVEPESAAARSAAQVFEAISIGNPPAMPAFEDQLSEDERWILAEYLRSFGLGAGVELIRAQATLVSTPGQPESSAAPSASPTPLNSGTITGTVENLSGGEVPQGIEILLHGFDQDSMVINETTTLQPDGTYTFENVEMPNGRSFFTTLQHQGVTYGSQLAGSETGVSRLDLPIPIYDTTSDTGALKVDRLHLFLEPVDSQTIRVGELYIMSNTGDKTIVAAEEGQPSVTFNLPAGAQDVQFEQGALGERFVQTEDGFGDTVAIYPGEEGSYQILLAYTMPYQRKAQFTQEMTLPVDAVVVMAPQNTFKVKGEGLQPAPARDVNGISYDMYNGVNLAAGDTLELTVSGGRSFSLSSDRTSLIIGLAALGVALIIGGVWMYFRNRSKEPALTTESPAAVAEPVADDTSESLMDAILALDDQYQAGEIPEEAYHQRRDELKQRLQAVMGKE